MMKPNLKLFSLKCIQGNLLHKIAKKICIMKKNY